MRAESPAYFSLIQCLGLNLFTVPWRDHVYFHSDTFCQRMLLAVIIVLMYRVVLFTLLGNNFIKLL